MIPPSLEATMPLDMTRWIQAWRAPPVWKDVTFETISRKQGRTDAVRGRADRRRVRVDPHYAAGVSSWED